MRNIDSVADLILNLFLTYGLTLEELGSINHYVLKNSLYSPESKQFIKENYNKEIEDLTPGDVAMIQETLVYSYTIKLQKEFSDGQADS